MGGVTYEEAREIALLNKKGGQNIFIGGTTIHNSKTFLAEVSQLAFEKRDVELSMSGIIGEEKKGGFLKMV